MRSPPHLRSRPSGHLLPRRADQTAHAVLAALLWLGFAAPGAAQLTSADIAELREKAAREGWTFTVGENPATALAIDQLCGLRPDRAVKLASRPALPRIGGLPTAFDWRELDGCTPVKDQGNCGACWAFATVGALESAILIKDGVTVDLSEQWLVSCNRDDYGCDGGWFAHEYHLDTPDRCGGTGAVLEAAFPYAQTQLACGCPFPHSYSITAWAYVDTESTVPTVDDLKQAIYTRGPVSASVYADAGFQAYTGGIYNRCVNGEVNHGILLVGWDDNQGPHGVWIVRNSWGAGWGEAGYMRIPYDCANIGFGACYVEYAGSEPTEVTIEPSSVDFGEVQIGQVAHATLTVTNAGDSVVNCAVIGLDGPFAVEGDAFFSLSPGAMKLVSVRFQPTLAGVLTRTLALSCGGPTVAINGTGVGFGAPADRCADAPPVSDGSYVADNHAADTELTGACEVGSTADVWWAYFPPFTGTATVDTFGSSFDTVLSVYAECGGNELACNDDAGSSGTRTSRVQFAVDPQQVYLIRVGGFAGALGDVALNIRTDLPRLNLSGQIVDPNGAGVGGVTITGLADGPVSDLNGAWVSSVAHGSTVTLVPVGGGWTFEPPSRTLENVVDDTYDVDFVARPAVFTISGRITAPDGEPLSGVPLSGLPGTPVTNGAGEYAAEVPYGFSADVTPQYDGLIFLPPARNYRWISADRLADHYTGMPPTGALQLTLAPRDALTAGAAWRVDGGAWQSSGATVAGLSPGTHAVEYHAAPLWTAPEAETVLILSNQTTTATRTYVKSRYMLTLSVTPPEGGELSASPPPAADGTYEAGTKVSLTAFPAAGFHVLRWVGVDAGAAAVGESVVITMTADQNVSVEFGLSAVAGEQVGIPAAGLGPTLCGGSMLGYAALTALGLCTLKRRGTR